MKTKRDIRTYEGWMLTDGNPAPKEIYHCEHCGEIIRQTTKPFYFDYDFDRMYCKKRCALSS